MIEIQAPNRYRHLIGDTPSVFLAGSIELGKADDWQSKLIGELKDLDVVVINPRRKDWDNSWKQSINDPQFSQQVMWELDGLDDADVIALYFDPETKAPISLLELGLHAADHKIIMYCPREFYRTGNVEIVADRYSIPFAESWEEFVTLVREALS